jgi:hypothetical protein
MRVRAGGREYAGRGVDLRTVDVSAAELLRAIRRTGSTTDGDAGGESDGGDDVVTVACPEPGPVHDHVGHVRPDLALDLRAALAAAARSRGHEAPEREALAAARAALDDCEVPPVDLREARRRVAAAGEAERELRERVASLRGRVQALRETGHDADEAAVELEAAVRRLSEVETDRVAAEQRLDRAREAAREARDVRARRLELEDRVANLERAARASLAAAVYDEFAAAVGVVPGTGDAGDSPGAFQGDPVTAALAVVRVAAVEAPVVLAVSRVDDAGRAADRLDAPVVVV